MSADKIDFSEPITPTMPTVPLLGDSSSAPVLPPTESDASVPADATETSGTSMVEEDPDAEGELDIEMMDGTAPQERQDHELPTMGSKDSDLEPETPAGEMGISAKRSLSPLSPPPENIRPIKKSKPSDSASHSSRSVQSKSREPTVPPVATRPSSEGRETSAAHSPAPVPRVLSENNDNALTSDVDFQYHDASKYFFIFAPPPFITFLSV